MRLLMHVTCIQLLVIVKSDFLYLLMDEATTTPCNTICNVLLLWHFITLRIDSNISNFHMTAFCNTIA